MRFNYVERVFEGGREREFLDALKGGEEREGGRGRRRRESV